VTIAGGNALMLQGKTKREVPKCDYTVYVTIGVVIIRCSYCRHGGWGWVRSWLPTSHRLPGIARAGWYSRYTV
jgi:hypothetical protein